MADSESKKKINILKEAKKGKLMALVEKYIEGCDNKRFPNIAGFCRYCNIGQSELERLQKDFPYEFEKLYAALEDEALNSGVAVTLVGAYLKKWLGYGEEKKTNGENGGSVTVSFEHDILKDGE